MVIVHNLVTLTMQAGVYQSEEMLLAGFHVRTIAVISTKTIPNELAITY